MIILQLKLDSREFQEITNKIYLINIGLDSHYVNENKTFQSLLRLLIMYYIFIIFFLLIKTNEVK